MIKVLTASLTEYGIHPRWWPSARISLVCKCRRAVRPAPGRIPQADLLELVQGLNKDPPSLANCFNSGICSWLCRHR